MDLVLFGIQGSGKGTQAKRLAKEFGYEIFEAGGELRKIAASRSELGKKITSYIDKGALVPHEIIMEVVKEAIGKIPKTQKILFDGIPRDAMQQRDFDRIMNQAGRQFTCIHLLLSRDKAVKRIIGRAQEQGRNDDKDLTAINRRMTTFVESTLPILARYKHEGKVIEINGDRTMDEVYGSLEKMVRSLEK